jgi:hypothetical protein
MIPMNHRGQNSNRVIYENLITKLKNTRETLLEKISILLPDDPRTGVGS